MSPTLNVVKCVSVSWFVVLGKPLPENVIELVGMSGSMCMLYMCMQSKMSSQALALSIHTLKEHIECQRTCSITHQAGYYRQTTTVQLRGCVRMWKHGRQGS